MTERKRNDKKHDRVILHDDDSLSCLRLPGDGNNPTFPDAFLHQGRVMKLYCSATLLGAVRGLNLFAWINVLYLDRAHDRVTAHPRIIQYSAPPDEANVEFQV